MKRLILKLSSLGDVVLNTAILEIPHWTQDHQIDWLVSHEFKEILEGHPQLNQVIPYDRSIQGFQGFKHWIRVCRQLWLESYEEIYDCHGSLRTLLLRILFFYWGMISSKKPKFYVIPKQRIKRFFYFLFKDCCPVYFRPGLQVVHLTRFLGGTGQERPRLDYLLDEIYPLPHLPFLCVMPSSRWKEKTWPVLSYVELLVPLAQKFSWSIVVLGRSSDESSYDLVQQLQAQSCHCWNTFSSMSFKQIAFLLKHSLGYLGSDTGLAHFAEALGVRSFILFGPTTPDLGFGPWRPDSQSLGMKLGCRPCSKDGRWCYRWFKKQKCLKDFSTENMLSQWNLPHESLKKL